jgi:hypothetical protein
MLDFFLFHIENQILTHEKIKYFYIFIFIF